MLGGLLVVLDQIWVPRGNFGCYFGNFSGLGPHLDPKGARDPTNVRFERFLSLKGVLVELIVEHFF